MTGSDRRGMMNNIASMKVPPKRKGNEAGIDVNRGGKNCLNESPSEKEGKFWTHHQSKLIRNASMKVPPKRKGNRPLSPMS